MYIGNFKCHVVSSMSDQHVLDMNVAAFFECPCFIVHESIKNRHSKAYKAADLCAVTMFCYGDKIKTCPGTLYASFTFVSNLGS